MIKNAIEDLEWWIKNKKIVAIKILQLIQQISLKPFEGLGKPEALKFELAGCWSRRINAEHRIVYHVTDTKIKILQCRYNYS